MRAKAGGVENAFHDVSATSQTLGESGFVPGLILGHRGGDTNNLGIADDYEQSAYLFLSLKHLHRHNHTQKTYLRSAKRDYRTSPTWGQCEGPGPNPSYYLQTDSQDRLADGMHHGESAIP